MVFVPRECLGMILLFVLSRCFGPFHGPHPREGSQVICDCFKDFRVAGRYFEDGLNDGGICVFHLFGVKFAKDEWQGCNGTRDLIFGFRLILVVAHHS